MSFVPNMSARYLKTLSLIRIRTKRELPVRVQCHFTSTETIRLIRDGEPRAATSTFTQLLSSEGFSSLMNEGEGRGEELSVSPALLHVPR